jgi:hypothetical protein
VQRQHAHAHSKHVEVQQLQRRSVDLGVGHTEAAGRVRMNTGVAHVCVRDVYTGVCTLINIDACILQEGPLYTAHHVYTRPRIQRASHARATAARRAPYLVDNKAVAPAAAFLRQLFDAPVTAAESRAALNGRRVHVMLTRIDDMCI